MKPRQFNDLELPTLNNFPFTFNSLRAITLFFQIQNLNIRKEQLRSHAPLSKKQHLQSKPRPHLHHGRPKPPQSR